MTILPLYNVILLLCVGTSGLAREYCEDKKKNIQQWRLQNIQNQKMWHDLVSKYPYEW